MSKNLLFLFILSLTANFNGFSQIEKTVNILDAGLLENKLTAEETSTITNLTISGVMDARDFRFIRDEMTAINSLDISSVTIEGYIGEEGTSTETDYPENQLPEYAFYNAETKTAKISLQSIVFPYNITSIGAHAFYNCYGLNGALNIPNNVVEVQRWAFTTCTGITEVNLGESLNHIGDGAFMACSSITEYTVAAENSSFLSVEGVLFNFSQTILILYPHGRIGNYAIPEGVEIISGSAFYGTSQLTEITFPNSLTHIEGHAFYLCTSLTSIQLSSNIQSIASRAFTKCSSLEEIIVDEENNNYSTEDGVLFNKEKTRVIHYPAAKQGHYIVPSSVTYINNRAFAWCHGLTGITLPENLTFIADAAFYGCGNIEFMEILSLEPPAMGGAVFIGVTPDEVLVPAEAINAYKEASGWSVFEETYFHEPFTITINTTNGGVVLVNDEEKNIGDEIMVENGEDLILVLSPQEGHELITFKKNQEDITHLINENQYTITQILEDITLDIVFGISISTNLHKQNSTISVFTQQNSVIVEGLSAGEEISVFNLNGNMVYKNISNGGQNVISLPNGSVYLIVVEKTTYKTAL